MTIARQYIIYAKQGHEDDLRDALAKLAELVRPSTGCNGVALLQDLSDPRRFIFTEAWDSEEAHKTAQNPEAHAFLLRILPWYDGPPEGTYFSRLKSI